MNTTAQEYLNYIKADTADIELFINACTEMHIQDIAHAKNIITQYSGTTDYTSETVNISDTKDRITYKIILRFGIESILHDFDARYKIYHAFEDMNTDNKRFVFTAHLGMLVIIYTNK